MKWMKNSNVITVTKSVTSIDSVVTRYLLSSKSEGVTIDGEIWSDVKPYPTSDRKYVWAYETYYYTDRTTGSTQPYIVDTYQSPRFEVTFSSDSYEVHPRWSSDSYFEFSISLLNGLTGTPQFVMVSSSRGIGIPVLDENTGKYLISIANSIDTATSFTFKIIIKDCVETFTVYGKLVDSDSKYIGTVTSFPDKNTCIDGDRCFYKISENEGSVYVFDSNSESWKPINESGLSSTEKNLIYTEAMKDIIDNIPSSSSILSEYGFFDTVISNIIKSETSFVDEMFAKNLTVEEGNFKFEITSGIINVTYDGKTVFQISPSNGNVFFGSPNSSLSAPASGFMYDAENQSIVSVNGKVKILSSGVIEAIGASIKDATMETIEMNGSDIKFGSKGKFYSSVSWPQGFLSAWQLMMFCYMVWPESPYQPKSFSGTATVNGYSVTNGYVTLDPLNIAIKFYTSSPTSSTATPYIQVRGNEGNNKSYVSINGGTESEITSGDIHISFIADSPACVKTLQPWSARTSGFSASTIGSPMHPMDSVISRLGVFSDIRLGGTGVLNDGSYYIDNKMQEGSTRLPGGIILKWAKLPATGESSADWRVWNYAYPFPNNCIMAFSFFEKSDTARDDYAYGYPMFFSGQQAVFSSWGVFNSYALALGY